MSEDYQYITSVIKKIFYLLLYYGIYKILKFKIHVSKFDLTINVYLNIVVQSFEFPVQVILGIIK